MENLSNKSDGCLTFYEKFTIEMIIAKEHNLFTSFNKKEDSNKNLRS